MEQIKKEEKTKPKPTTEEKDKRIASRKKKLASAKSKRTEKTLTVIINYCLEGSPELLEKELQFTKKEILFAHEYAIDGKAERSAKAAGYPDSIASSKAYTWVKPVNPTRPELVEYINALRKIRIDTADIKANDVCKELVYIGFSNIADVLILKDNCLTVRNLDEIPERYQRCIESISQTANGLTVKFYDKLKSLAILGKITGLITEPKLEINMNSHDEFIKKHSNLLPMGNGRVRSDKA